MQRRHMPRTHLALLLSAVLFGLIACAIQGTTHRTFAPVPPQEWQKERGPVVPHDSFPRDCSLCHEGSSWHQIRSDFTFDHEKETGVKLEGAHAAAECLRCHNDRGPVDVFAEQGCAGCHEDVHRTRLGTNCQDCHTQTNWLPNEQVAKHARTRFPLVGAHTAVACFRCHDGADQGNFDRPSIECVDCHADQLAQATNPNHVAQGYTSNCDRCHIPTTWGGAGFNHATFPLTGAHASTACAECHQNDVFAGTPSACSACHSDDFAATTNPNHATAGFPTTCNSCHGTNTWDQAHFLHDFWPLTGVHASQNCSACHAGGVFRGTPSTCVACHQDDYDGANDPPHASANLPTTCQQCHNTSSWSRATFTHQGITNGCVTCHLADYNGATNPNHVAQNISTQCQQCHTSTRTWDGASFSHAGITNGCVNCHQTDYDGATNPNHVANNISTQCQQCHTSTRTWDGASFNHTGITNGCVNCHQTDYNGATSPNHVAMNFSTQCQQCHTSTRTWDDATFNHRGITNGCLTCHQTDYNGATSPNHPGQGYPTNCQFCHTTTTWDSNFNHQSYFPINNGPHHVSCIQCHTNTSNPAQFTCITCHQQGETNNDHDRVSGYSYNSNACYNCHPDGND